MIRASVQLIPALLVLSAGSAFGQSVVLQPNRATFTPLGMLPGHVESAARDVSDNGAVIIGASSDRASGGGLAVRWTSGTQIECLTPTMAESAATGVSRDGRVIVGSFTNMGSPDYVAMFWTQETGMVSLADFPGGGLRCAAYGVNDDGSIIVGLGYSGSNPVSFYDAGKWDARGIVKLNGPSMSYPASNAVGVSQDGRVIVGWFNSDVSGERAFRWTWQTGMVDLGGVDGRTRSSATKASRDGSVVVGDVYYAPNKTDSLAFRWTSAGMESLGVLQGDTLSGARAVSADGSVVVGLSGVNHDSGNTNHAFYWTRAQGMLNLQDVLVAHGAKIPAEWRLTSALGISSDGRIIVGVGVNADGHAEAWKATLP